MATKKDAAQKQADEQLKVNEKKWSKTLMNSGWTALPSVILERQQALGLDAIDVNILMHLASYWWTAENKPHPSKKTIAAAIGIDSRTVQRHIARLEAGNLIKREQRRLPGKGSKTNLYHFDGLIEAATPYAQEKLENIARRQAEQAARAKKKGKPILTVVSSEDD